MIADSLIQTWTGVAPRLGDHLWQSTLFAAVAGLLTLALRKNHARARYWLWMAASIKFLIPFSWLVAAGSRLSWLRTPDSASAVLYTTIEEVSQPFGQSVAAVASVAPKAAWSVGQWLPLILAGVWFCGFVAVIFAWCVRWWKISSDVRSAVRLSEGREVEALRRAEQVTGLRKRVEMLLSRATLEPGIFGMTRPALVWPEGISERLEAPHLEAIMAHELLHVRGRDNLAALVHMLVEAIFWFYPLVWWVGTRLIDERERACDEEVLELGSERQVYAESILKVCEFCVGSPLACVSGVTGADLKKRMVHIMSEQVARKLDFGRKLLLGAVAALAITAPILFGLVHATPTRAQSQDQVVSSSLPENSVSIKPSATQTQTPAQPGVKSRVAARMMFGPDGFVAGNVTMRALIQEAFGVQSNQIVGGPEWLDTELYDAQIGVKQTDEEKADVQNDKVPNTPTFRHDPGWKMPMIRQMLHDALSSRTKLVVHDESRDLPNYVLTVAELGSKLQPVTTYSTDKVVPDHQGANISFRQTQGLMMHVGEDQVMDAAGHGVSMQQLATLLSRELGTTVVDKTGLAGNYAFDLHWSGAKDDVANLISAVQEQLGLKLESQTSPTEVLVIDHIEKPAEN
jgi:bla regulator protein BlaR1